MERLDEFRALVDKGYTFKGPSMNIGCAMLDGEPLTNCFVKIPLKTLNRHGLIAGATGTGKTKTLQNVAELLSDAGVGVLLMDVKGDLSGLAAKGDKKDFIDGRHEKIGFPWQQRAYPVDLLTLSDEKGARLRATVSEFGPVLFSKILNLNETQSGIVSLVFKYCDDHGLPLLDLKDFKKAVQYLTGPAKEEIKEEYGSMSSVSVGTIMRKMIELEEQGAERFFGEKSFDVKDLTRKTHEGKGFINCLRLVDIQGKPKLFSTFMLSMLAEIYQQFPEVGDKAEPKLVIFIDEAHLVFKEASDALMDQIETIIKLIRSKGVGIFFCTQNPTDIPDVVLSQLGLKMQHALRAFTAKDRKAIKQTSENYPETDYYKVDKDLTSLGIGECFITALNEKGIPTPLVHTMLKAPYSRMDVLSTREINALVKKSSLVEKYAENIDRESAYEILMAKLKKAEKDDKRATPKTKRTTRKRNKSVVEKVTGNSAFKVVVREVTRGLLGALGIKRR